MEANGKKRLGGFLILLMLVVLGGGLASWLTPKPQRTPGGAETVFATPSTPASASADPVPSPADPDDPPARITLFLDLNREDMTALLERLERWSAEEGTVEIVTYNTKNQQIIYENQVKSACSEKNPGVAILQDPGEKTEEFAENLQSAGYQVVTLFSSEENTKNHVIRANIAQNWTKTAQLTVDQMARKAGAGEGYLLLLDGSSPDTENAFRRETEFYNFGTAYGYKNSQIAEDYVDFALKALPELGYMLLGSEELTQGALSGAETVKTLAAQGVEGYETVNTEARFGALFLSDRVLTRLKEGTLDFGVGVTVDDVFEKIRNILPDIQQGKYLGQRRLEPTLITPETAESYKFGY